MKSIRVHKMFWTRAWAFECDVCHYGHDIPWTEVGDFATTWAAVDAHVTEHARVGKRLEWSPLRLPANCA